MKINDRNPASGAVADPARSQESQRVERDGRPGSTSRAGSGDRVELSGLAGSVSRSLVATAAERASRVAALAADYRSGRYLPGSEATSRAMIADALGAGAA
jgi:hypothetical protein